MTGYWTDPVVFGQTYALRWRFFKEQAGSFDFEILVVSGWRTTVEYHGAQGSTPDPDVAVPLVKGFVRHDGCTQFTVDDAVHVDGDDGLVAIHEALVGARGAARDCYGEDWAE